MVRVKLGAFKRIRLRAGIATAFMLLVVPAIGIMIGYIYRTNADLALVEAAKGMDRITADIVDEVQNLLSPVARVVEGVSVQAKVDPASLRRVEGLRYFLDQVENLPQVYSFYIAFARDGGFYQAVHLPPGIASFGPGGKAPPDKARFVLRILDESSSRRADSYLYLAKWGDLLKVERGQSTYDPRTRPWYKAAWQTGGTAISDVYGFSSTGKPGLTISKRVESDDGVEIGTVGADIALDTLSAFLERKRIGQEGRVFLLDSEDRLIVHPQPGMGLRITGKTMDFLKATEVPDRVVADAVANRQAGLGNRFTAPLGEDKLDYIVSFAPLPEKFQKKWTIGVVVQEDEFIGPLRRLSLKFVGMGMAVIVLSTIAIMWLAHRLTKPLFMIVKETEKIREFQLDGDVKVDSHIREVHELAQAMASMKRSLRSFGAYVPKALVRNILASGISTQVGGERQFLSIMFTDIKDFTKNSDAVPPEDISVNLSAYFEEMSAAVHRNKGIIDKFIGDAIMALWNTPVQDPDHVVNACRSMLACRDVSRILDARMQERGAMPLYTRFGLHCGQMMVGNVGSADRMQYTVMGSAVNLAARLEGLNKVYGTQLLCTEAVVQESRGLFLFRMVDRVVPSGVSTPIPIYELMGELDPASSSAAAPRDLDFCRQWEQAMAAFLGRDWAHAAALFQAVADGFANDKAALLYVDRCTRYLAAPPEADWDGAQRYTEK